MGGSQCERPSMLLPGTKTGLDQGNTPSLVLLKNYSVTSSILLLSSGVLSVRLRSESQGTKLLIRDFPFFVRKIISYNPRQDRFDFVLRSYCDRIRKINLPDKGSVLPILLNVDLARDASDEPRLGTESTKLILNDSAKAFD